MADVFAELEKDHIEVKEILAKLETGHGDIGQLAEKLVMDESRHEAAEEMYFWPSVRENVTGGDALADEAIAQENEGKRVLDELRKAEVGSPEFLRLVAEFTKAGREHIAFEESRVWPELRLKLSAEQQLDLGSKIETAKKTGPTRPHPQGPDGPGGLKTVGAAAAMADKAADAVTGRGKADS